MGNQPRPQFQNGIRERSICYSQRVNATSQYNDSGSSRCSKWPNNRMVAVMNIAGSLYKDKEATEKDD